MSELSGVAIDPPPERRAFFLRADCLAQDVQPTSVDDASRGWPAVDAQPKTSKNIEKTII